MVAHVLEGVVLIVPVPGHGLPWRLVVPPSLGHATAHRYAKTAKPARLRPPIMFLRLSVPEEGLHLGAVSHPPPIANIIEGRKDASRLISPCEATEARHHGGPFCWKLSSRTALLEALKTTP